MNPWWLALAAACACVLFVGVDVCRPEFRAGLWRDGTRARRNGAYLLANIATLAILSGLNRALEARLPSAFSWEPSGSVVEVAACLLVAELMNWLSHWIKHKVPWLWTFHVQHHVSRRYDTTLVLHTHGLEVIVSGVLMSVILLLCGFSRFSVDVFALVYAITNLYKHQSARLGLGFLDALIVSPAYHRVHHARGHSGNYGSVLTVFDILFGTAIWPQQKGEDVFRLAVGVEGQSEGSFVDEMLLPWRH